MTVCGPVVNTRNEKLITGAGRDAVLSTEISLDFDHPYPKQTFLVVIYPVDEENFDRGPEELLELYRDKEVCATGRIDFSFIGTFIRAYEQSQIEVME